MTITAQQKAAFAAEIKAIEDERIAALARVAEEEAYVAAHIAETSKNVQAFNVVAARMIAKNEADRAKASDTWTAKMRGIEARLTAATQAS